MANSMDFSKPGQAPEPLTEEQLFDECKNGKHDECIARDVDDWNRSSVCVCSCHRSAKGENKNQSSSIKNL